MDLEKFKYKIFGRFKGRKNNQKFSESFINKYKLNIKADLEINNYNILDIGSGSGENSILLADQFNKSFIIACDLFHDGNLNLCNILSKENKRNVRLYEGNVLELLDSLESNNIFNEIWILFPDPWPKNRHHKRRLINDLFLRKLHSFLCKSGKLMIASDSHSYIQAILKTIFNNQEMLI